MTAQPVEPDIRRRLIDAAARLLSEEGPSRLSTRRLAAEVGTSTMAVYTYFGGLPALVQAVVTEGFTRLAQRLAAVASTDDPILDLMALADAYRENARANPHLYAVMFGTASLGGYRRRGQELDQGRETFDVLVEGVRRATAAGRLRDDDPERLAGQMWSALHGYVTLELAGFFHDSHGDTDKIMWPLLARLAQTRPYPYEANDPQD